MATKIHYLIGASLSKYSRRAKPRIIDYGCGSGDLLAAIGSANLKKYVGYDVNHHSLTILRRTWSDKHVRVQLVDERCPLNLGRTNRFDAVVSIGVWQYLSDHQIKRLCTQAHRVLRQDGVFIFSCAHRSWWYRLINVYALVLPHRDFSRSEVETTLINAGFKVKKIRARGLFFNPLFSYCLVFFFDAIDKIVFRTQGTLGPIGRWVRDKARPLLDWELELGSDRGYTLFVEAVK